MNKNNHANISIFVPHNGCQHQCSFCNQKTITGQSKQPSILDVQKILSKAKKDLCGSNKTVQVAFFGGSFTAIEKNYMIQLLDTAFEYVKDNTFDSIRLSTRPDAITDEILDILKSRGVKDIELGCQSMDDTVLNANQRGHTQLDIIKASHKIKKYGFSLGLQMMTGLYKSTIEKDKETAKKIIALVPDNVRIYPTVVMKGTLLSDLYLNGEYKTYSFDETVSLCAYLLELFEKNNIPVIRLGLHNSEELKNNMIAGAYHPALRELCEGEIFLNNVLIKLKQSEIYSGEIIIYVNPKNLSKVIGQKKCNVIKLANMGFKALIKADETLSEKEIIVKRF